MEKLRKTCPLWALMRRCKSECPGEQCSFYSAELEACALTALVEAVDEMRLNVVPQKDVIDS